MKSVYISSVAILLLTPQLIFASEYILGPRAPIKNLYRYDSGMMEELIEQSARGAYNGLDAQRAEGLKKAIEINKQLPGVQNTANRLSQFRNIQGSTQAAKNIGIVGKTGRAALTGIKYAGKAGVGIGTGLIVTEPQYFADRINLGIDWLTGSGNTKERMRARIIEQQERNRNAYPDAQLYKHDPVKFVPPPQKLDF